MATNNEYLNNFNALYDKFYTKLNTNPIEYNPQSASTLKDSLARAMRPAYDKQVQQRRETAAANRAAIDADASARGMGSSTWVTDVKNRQRDAEAKDIAGINSDYNSALYSALLNRLNAQDELSLSAQQANASARQNAQGQALSLAQGLYDKIYGAASTGGGGRSRSHTPETPPQGLYQDALTKLKKEGYTTKSAVDYLKKGNKNLQKVQKTPTQPTPKPGKKYSGFTTANE